MATHYPNARDRGPQPDGLGGPEDPVVYPADQDQRSYVGSSADDAHRRAAFGRRPTDVPLTYERRRSILPYVIGALLLLALIPLVGHLRGRDQVAARWGDTATTAAGGEVDRDAPAAPAGAKQRFSEWAAEGGNTALPQESEENHPYTSQGIRLLADALAEASQGVKIDDARQRIDDLRVQADRLQSSPGKDQHAEYAHAAFVSAAKLVAELHAAKRTAAGDADELTTAATVIKPDQPLSPQGENVRRFFRLAAKALP
jgi:hypothetical protein